MHHKEKRMHLTKSAGFSIIAPPSPDCWRFFSTLASPLYYALSVLSWSFSPRCSKKSTSFEFSTTFSTAERAPSLGIDWVLWTRRSGCWGLGSAAGMGRRKGAWRIGFESPADFSLMIYKDQYRKDRKELSADSLGCRPFSNALLFSDVCWALAKSNPSPGSRPHVI